MHITSLNKFSRASLLLFLLAIVCLSSCKDAAKAGKEPTIGVSIEPLRFFTERIAGDGFKVVSVVPAGYSPENYDPSPNQLMTLADCGFFFKVGNLGFENTWFQKVINNNADCQIFSLADAIETQPDDPHIWTSPKNARRFCQYICDALCRIDSANAAVYRSNADSLISRIDTVDAQIKQILDSIPCRTFLIAHPALSYFAKDYGLQQLSIETEGKEASVQDMQNLVLQCRKENVGVILVQAEFNRAAAESLAEEIHARIVEVNPLNYEWDEEMINIAKAIATAGK